METKVIIIGQEKPKQRELKKIEFTHLLNTCKKIEPTNAQPDVWDCIELICKNYSKDFDLMFGYDEENRSGGALYLGHFNDGIV